MSENSGQSDPVSQYVPARFDQPRGLLRAFYLSPAHMHTDILLLVGRVVALTIHILFCALDIFLTYL